MFLVEVYMFNFISSKWTEQQKRSISKVISWRILVTITNFFGGWIASGNPWVGLGVVSFALVVNSILYWFHERAWNRTDWGKQIVPPEETPI
jgi:uncharacterized membrane protein